MQCAVNAARGAEVLRWIPEPMIQRKYTMSVETAYYAVLEKKGFQPDPAQLRAVQALERCANEWAQYKGPRSGVLKKFFSKQQPPKGVYMYGGVGRGKSFLMECFYQEVPIAQKTRLHFHEFMREVHRELQQLQGKENPLDILGANIAKKYRLICFDEFHVADVTDAMILHRLLVALFDNGVGLVTTSNFKPDELYPNGLHRDRILPAIKLLNERMDVISVDNGTDYRRRTLQHVPLYFCPDDEYSAQEMSKAFDGLSTSDDETPEFHFGSRVVAAKRRSDQSIWFDFKALCGAPLSQNDYLELANRFQTIFISNVPKMGVAQASEARRFTLLVDVLYDRHVKLILSAAVAPEQLYTEGPLSHEFPRTVSRLNEMQSQEYLELDKRIVDTALT